MSRPKCLDLLLRVPEWFISSVLCSFMDSVGDIARASTKEYGLCMGGVMLVDGFMSYQGQSEGGLLLLFLQCVVVLAVGVKYDISNMV